MSARVQYVLYREENFAKAASSTAEEVDQEDADQLEAADRAADRAGQQHGRHTDLSEEPEARGA